MGEKYKFFYNKKFIVIGLLLNLAILFSILVLYFGGNGITGFVVANFEDYRVYITDSYAGKNVNFIMPVDNGPEPIDNAYAEIRILDSKGEQVAFLETEKIGVFANEKAELKTTWTDSGAEGLYQARIFIFNDDKSYSFSKNFRLDQKTLVFESVVFRDFDLGEIVNMSAIIQNYLDEDLYNVSISILILDDFGDVVSEIVSEEKGIGGNSTSQFGISWDTANIDSGRYNAQMIINYGEDFIEKDLVVNIQDGSFDIIGIGYSIAKDVPASKYDSPMFFLVILLIVINLMWILYYIKSKK